MSWELGRDAKYLDKSGHRLVVGQFECGTLTKDRGGYKTTPAMAAGITDRIGAHRDIAELLD